MTAVERERIAKLEQTVQVLIDEVRQGREDIQALQKTIDQLSGGKQALIWVTGTILTISALVIALLNYNKHN